MAARAPNIDQLILDIHSTVLADDGWTQVGDDLCRVLSADSASFCRPVREAANKPWCRLFDIDASFMTEYIANWGHLDVWYQGALRNGRLGVGLVNMDSQLIEHRECKKTPFFNEYLKLAGVDRMMNVCLVSPSTDGRYGPLAMSFYRGPGKGAFSSGAPETLTRLAPHLIVAAQNYWSAKTLRVLSGAYRSAVDSVTSAVFGVDGAARIVFANQSGEEMLRQRCWLRVVNGRLEPSVRFTNHLRLSKALNQVSIGTSFNIIVNDEKSGAQAIVRGAPIPATEPIPFHRSAVALVWLTPTGPSDAGASDLAKLFNLTPAEQRLVAQLIAGHDMRAAAFTLEISVHTARTQLKAVFSKTSLRTQAALLSFAAKLATLRS